MTKYLSEEGLKKYNELLQKKFISSSGGEIPGGNNLVAGENIEIVDNVISVQTADSVEEDNTKPITSAAVYTEVGNITILLETI